LDLVDFVRINELIVDIIDSVDDVLAGFSNVYLDVRRRNHRDDRNNRRNINNVIRVERKL
jgi:hypothetical protein